ncbi:MAG: type II secretion system F family protein [bacterium]
MKNILFIFAFATVALLGEAVYLQMRSKDDKTEKSIRESLQAIRVGATEKKPGGSILWVNVFSKNPGVHKLLALIPFSNSLDTLLDQAGTRMLLDRFLLLVVFAAWSCSSVVFVVTKSPLYALLGLVAGIIGPWLYLKLAKRHRMAKLTKQLPEALDTIVRSLRTGFALSMSFEVVAKEFSAPISTEFRKINEENRLGVSMKDSLENLLHRCDNMDMKLFVTSVLIQWDVGSNLTEVLDKLSYTIRERFKLKGHIKALTAEGRLSGWLLGLLPIGMGIIINYISPNYMEPLFTTPLGNTMLYAAGGLVILGAVLIKKIVTFDI